MKQINNRDYASKAKEDGYKNIIKYGVAFKGKMCYAVAGVTVNYKKTCCE